MRVSWRTFQTLIANIGASMGVFRLDAELKAVLRLCRTLNANRRVTATV